MGFLCLSYANAYSITIHHNVLSSSISSSRVWPCFHRSISKSRAFTNRLSKNFSVKLVQQQNHRFVHLAPPSNVNAGWSEGEYPTVDDPNNETEVWDYFKHFQWEHLVLPIGFGVVVAILAARQRATVFFLLFLLIFLLAQRASVFQGGQSNSRATVSPKSWVHLLLTAKKFIASRGLFLFVGFLTALRAVLRKMPIYVNKFVASAESFLVPIEQDDFTVETQPDGLTAKTAHHSIKVQHQEENGFKIGLPPLHSSHPGDSSERLDVDIDTEQLDLVLSDVKICISKLEHMMARGQRSLTLGDIVCSKVRKALDLLKCLNTDLSLMGGQHDVSHLQRKLTKGNCKTKPDELLQFNTSQLCSSADTAGTAKPEIFKAISNMKKTGEGDHLNIPALRESESAALGLSAAVNLPISHGESVNQGIHEVVEVKGVSAANVVAQEVCAGDASFCQEAQGSDSGGILDSDGDIMFRSNPSQGEQSLNVGHDVPIRVESLSKQSNFDLCNSKADRNQINGSIMSSAIQASVVNENDGVKREDALPKTLQDAGDLEQLIDQNGLKSAFDTSTSSLIGNLSESSKSNIEEFNRHSSGSEDLITIDSKVRRALPQESLDNRKFNPEEQQIAKNNFDSISSASEGHLSKDGTLNGGSQGKEYNGISEHQGASRRKSRIKRHQQVFESDSNMDDPTKFGEYPVDDMKFGVKSSGSRDGRKNHRKAGIDKSSDMDFGATRGATEGTRHRSVTEKVTSRVSPTGFTGQQVSGPTSGFSEKSSFLKGDGPFMSASTKKTDYMQDDQDLPHRRGVSSVKQKEEHQRIMDEGESFFMKGKAGLSGKVEVGVAETMLYKAADLFASAAAIDPCSIEAVGFWGNTLLVHGELKLRVSRELRMMLSSADILSPYQPMPRGRVEKESATDETEELDIRQTLQVVCEECEGLLLEAGRKYRRALSIDKSDIRALYNWGLALCFRAQLIAEGRQQNAAEDADKVYVAAIDKFEAMMGISQSYAPGAMLNWGLALRDRSRLRPMGSKDRIRLLQQAIQLFQDALQLNPDDAQIRGALATCNVELKEMQESEAVQSKSRQIPKFGTRQGE